MAVVRHRRMVIHTRGKTVLEENGQRNEAVEHDEGITILVLEGPRNKREADLVCQEIANGMNRAHHEGRSWVMLSLPSIVKLKVARGKRVELSTTADNRVILKLIGTPSGEGLLLPGRNF